jgi:hypothetical protein
VTHDRLHSHSASTSYRCSQVVGIVALASLAARGRRVVKLSFYPRGARANPRPHRHASRQRRRRCAIVYFGSSPLFRRRLRMSTFTGRSPTRKETIVPTGGIVEMSTSFQFQ